MLLEKLNEYSERLDLPPSLYAEGPVRYWINLDHMGRFLPPVVDTSDPSNPRTQRGRRHLLPQVVRSSGIRPLLLADKADYTFGLAAVADRISQAKARHRAYLELVERCASETQEPDVESVLAFLKGGPLGQVNPGEEFDAAGVISFKVDGRCVVDHPAVQAFWERVNSDPDAPVMQCLVCGCHRPVLQRLQAKIKGIPGGHPSGTSFLSANAAAFESYGLTGSLTSPACSTCAEGFTRGLNALLNDSRNMLDFVSTVSVFWTREPQEFDFPSMVESPDPIQVSDLMRSIRTGQSADLDYDLFYAVSMSANGGRVTVRDWIVTHVGQVKKSLAGWFQGQRIAAGFSGEQRYHGLRALAFSTVRDPRDLPGNTARALVHAALTGLPLPMNFLALAVRQNRIENRVTRPRAALIKLALLNHEDGKEEDFMVWLDTDNVDPAYLLGRLLAVLERAQREAVRGINSTVSDRYYGTASSAPQAVFPILLRGARSHLQKLKRDNPGAFVAIEVRKEEIMSKLDANNGLPKSLNLRQQGVFTLGYYHQKAHDFGQMREALERRHDSMGREPGRTTDGPYA